MPFKWRRWSIAAAALLAVVLLLVALAHAPVARRWALEAAASRLRSSLGVELSAERVHYNLALLSARLEGVRLAASGRLEPATTAHAPAPFFEADEVAVDLPWSAVVGALAFQSIAVTAPRVTIGRDADGVWNLPDIPARDEPGGPLAAFAIGSVAIRDGRVGLDDRLQGLAIDLDGLSVDLASRPGRPLTGTIAIAGPTRITAGGRQTVVERIDLPVTFDGTTVSLAGVELKAPEAQVRATASIDVAASPPSVAADYSFVLDLDRVSPWLGEDPGLRGDARVEGRVSGPLAEPVMTLSVSAEALGWRSVDVAGLRASGRLSGQRLEIEALEAEMADGRVSANGTVGLAAGAGGEVSATWRGLALGGVLESAGIALPLALGSRLEGRLEASWDEPRAGALRIAIDNDASPGGPPRSLPVAGRTTLTVRDGQWRLAHEGTAGEAAVSLGAAGPLDVEDVGASPVRGTLRLSAPDIGGLVTALAGAGLTLDSVAALDPDGRVDARLAIAGEVAAPSLEGAVMIGDFSVLGASPGSLTTTLWLDTRGVAARGVDARAGGARLTGEVSARFDTKALDGRLEGDVADVAPFLGDLGARWRPTGAARFAAGIGGTFAAPAVEATVRSNGLDIAGQRLDRVSAGVRLAGSTLAIEAFEAIQSGGGRLTLDGRHDFGTGRYAVVVEGEGLELRPIPAGESGREALAIGGLADVRFEGAGSLDRPAGSGSLDIRQLTWADGSIGPVRAVIELGDGRATIDASAAELRTWIEGTVALEAPHAFTLTGDVDGGRIERLLAVLSADASPVTGTLALGLTASGRLDDLDGTDAWIHLGRLDARSERGVLALARPTTLRYEYGAVAADSLELVAGETTLSVSGRLARSRPGGRLDLRLAGNLEDLAPFIPALVDDDLTIAGAIDLQVTASGSAERPDITADLRVSDGWIAAAALAPASDIAVAAAYRDGVIDVGSVGWLWQDVRLAGRGRLSARFFAPWLPDAYLASLPPAPAYARLDARLEGITGAVLAPWVSPETLEQTTLSASASIALEADRPALEALRGEVVLDSLAATIAGAQVGQQVPTRLTLEAGRLRVADLSWTSEGLQTRISGAAGLTDGRLDLEVQGSSDLRLVGALVPGIVTEGRAELNVRVHGTLDDPLIDGRVSIAGGGLRARQPRLVMSGLAGVVDLARDRIATSGLTGTMNGGAVTIAGDLLVGPARGEPGRATFTGRGIALEIPQGLRTEIDADVALAFTGGAPRLSGTLTIRRGAYRETLVLTQQVLSQLDSRSETIDLGVPSVFDDVQLDIAVATASPVVLDNNYGRMELESELRLGGTIGRPALGGRLTLEEGGRLFLGGRTYQIERGSIAFVDPAAITPDLDLVARTQVRGYDISLSIRGTPDRLETTLSSESDPTLKEADLLSLLAFGQTADESGTLMSAQTGVQVLQMLSGDILGFAGRAVGVDSVRIDRGPSDDLFGADPALIAAETDPGQRLSVSKNLSSNVEIVLSQNLKESGGVTWIAIYRPTRSFEIRAVARDDDTRALQVSQQLQFGGTPAASSTSAPREPLPLVESIVVSGVDEADRAQVHRRLGIRTGGRLDFYEWQEDRDRIERYFHDRGYYEAHVRVHREDLGGSPPGVAIEYEVVRGPRTRLEVAGFPLSDNARRDIERAWTEAVFDGFLAEDARSRAIRSLARRGYLRPVVEAQIAGATGEDAEVKVLRVTVDPGPHTPVQRLEFRGNDSIPRETLDAEVERRGLGLVAWLDPRAFAAAIAAVYERQGRLAATVTVGEPRFEGDTAALPVVIDEGPAFIVSRIRVAGATATTEADVRAAFGLEEGDVYTATAAEDGRQAVGAAYRREGFNEVAVRLDRTVDRAAGQVALGLEIVEGPQQVLSGVEVEGRGPTSRGLIDNAIRARVGDPVVAADWFDARRRLYELGVFRSADVAFEDAGSPIARDGVIVQPSLARVSLVPAPLYRFRYGFEVADEVAPSSETRQTTAGFTGDLQRRNLFGRGLTVGGTGRYEWDLWLLRGFASVPRFFTLPITTSFYLTRSHQDVRPGEDDLPFTDDRWIATAEQEVRRRRTLRLSWGYRFERNHVFDPDPNPDNPFPLDFTVDTARLTSALSIDTRSDPFAPRGGWFAGATLEYAVPGLGSDIDFTKVLTQGSYFHAIGPVVLGSAGRVGWLFGPNPLVSERFFTGGGTSVRGYAEDSLGPVDVFGDPAGGEGLLVLNQEVRVPIWGWFGAVGFVDAGNVFETAGGISLNGLRVGVGAGLRLDTPFVLVRLDYGVPVQRPEGSPFGRWYFSLGHIF